MALGGWVGLGPGPGILTYMGPPRPGPRINSQQKSQSKSKKEVLGMPGDRFKDLEMRFGYQGMGLSK